MAASFSEPSNRYGYCSAPVQETFCLWGGAEESTSTLESFDLLAEAWTTIECSGPSPLGLQGGACASAGDYVYQYGGFDYGSGFDGSLHQLDIKSGVWKELSKAGSTGAPLKKRGASMIAYANKLLVFGGWGLPAHPTQEGSQFIEPARRETNGSGWTNEVHTYDLQEGEITCPASL